jgi:O-antigen/teichoic acid export membrane protein
MKDLSQKRTKNYLSQMKGSIFYKAIAMGASFVVVPFMINYLGQEIYGVWSTLLTVLSWLVFFDLGVGNGVRNKVAEALASDDATSARDYIATGFGIIGLIALALLVIALISTHYVQWQVIFNTRAINQDALEITVQIAVFFIILNFWLGIINSIASAVQKTDVTVLGQMVANVFILAAMFALIEHKDASIKYVALVYGLGITLSNITVGGWFFKKYRELCAFPHIVKRYVQSLLGFGMQFFVIQVAVLVIFATDKILITQLLGPEYVAQYDVATKLFGVVIFFHSMISAPLWSAYTDAYQRRDFDWIGAMLKKQRWVFIVIIGLVIILGLMFDLILKIWVGDAVKISAQLVVFVGLFSIISVWCNMYAMISNGTGKIKLQMYTAIAAMLFNVPLALLFVNVFNLGICGVVLSNIISLLFSGVALPIQIHTMLKPHAVNSGL